MFFLALIRLFDLSLFLILCVTSFCLQEFALCLPTKSELQQSSGLSEEHCCESSVHGRGGPQSSFAGESRDVIAAFPRK